MAQQLRTVGDVAAQLVMSKRKVYRLMKEGKLRSLVVGRASRRIPQSEIDRYVEEQLAAAEEEASSQVEVGR